MKPSSEDGSSPSLTPAERAQKICCPLYLVLDESIVPDIEARITQAITDAVNEEREACAKELETYGLRYFSEQDISLRQGGAILSACGVLIRARGSHSEKGK